MTLPFQQMLQETFGDLQNLTPEKLQGLVQETVKVFTLLQENMKSADPKVKAEAMDQALNLRDTLQTQANTICKQLGMVPSQLASLAESSLSQSGEWSPLKQDLDSFRQQFASLQQSKLPPMKKHPKSKN